MAGQVHLYHPDRAYRTNSGLPGQHTFSELAGFLLPTFVSRLRGRLFTQIASELPGYLYSRRGLTPVRPAYSFYRGVEALPSTTQTRSDHCFLVVARRQ